MQIHLYDSAAQVGQAAATLIAAQIIAKPDSVLGLATGSTPIPTYQELIRLCKGGVLDFSRVRSFNLDEYCNLPADHEQSYHSFMRQQLFDHINIDPANTRVPDGNARDQAAECASYDTAINQAGGIDIQVLGIGATAISASTNPPIPSSTAAISSTSPRAPFRPTAASLIAKTMCPARPSAWESAAL